jgi:hypothetical protein
MGNTGPLTVRPLLSTFWSSDWVTGVHSADGCRFKELSWQPAGDCVNGCWHGAPTRNGQIRWDINGSVESQVHADANNGEPLLTGSVQLLGYAKVEFSCSEADPLANVTLLANSNPSFAEWAAEVSGEISVSSNDGVSASLKITRTLTGDVFSPPALVDSYSKAGNGVLGDISTAFLKGNGHVKVSASAFNGAYSAKAEAHTQVNTCNLTVLKNGTSDTCCDGQCPHDD